MSVRPLREASWRGVYPMGVSKVMRSRERSGLSKKQVRAASSDGVADLQTSKRSARDRIYAAKKENERMWSLEDRA